MRVYLSDLKALASMADRAWLGVRGGLVAVLVRMVSSLGAAPPIGMLIHYLYPIGNAVHYLYPIGNAI